MPGCCAMPVMDSQTRCGGGMTQRGGVESKCCALLMQQGDRNEMPCMSGEPALRKAPPPLPHVKVSIPGCLVGGVQPKGAQSRESC